MPFLSKVPEGSPNHSNKGSINIGNDNNGNGGKSKKKRKNLQLQQILLRDKANKEQKGITESLSLEDFLSSL